MTERVFTTKDAKSTKEKSIFLRFNALYYPVFVTFVIFVVTPYRLVNSSAYDHNNREFAQPVQIFKHSSAKSTKFESIK